MNLENIIKSIDSLEPLSDAIINIQQLYTEDIENLNINELVELIESDAILSVKILKMANSPVYGFSTKIASVSQAVTLFGIMQIYGFIMSYAVTQNIKANTEIFGYSNRRFNDICNLQSALLLKWYSKIQFEDARFLAPLALIMETGKLVISCEVSASSCEEAFKKGFKNSKDIKIYENDFVGATSYKLSSMVFKHWNLEPLYIKILDDLDNKNHLSEGLKRYVDILNVVITAVNLKSVLTKESVLNACQLLQKMHLDPNEFANVALSIKKSYINELKTRENDLVDNV
jgi:HD-like signal output (HDOD) protein